MNWVLGAEGLDSRNAPMKNVRVDKSDAPIIVAAFSRDYTTKDIAQFLLQLRELALSKKPFFVIFDLTSARPLMAPERKMFADALTRDYSSYQEYMRGAAIVTTNFVHRGVLTAVAWFVKIPFEVEIHSDLQAARRSAVLRLGMGS
jgi:hypothetical protein